MRALVPRDMGLRRMEGPSRPVRPCMGHMGCRPVWPCVGLMGSRAPSHVLMSMSPTVVVSTLVMGMGHVPMGVVVVLVGPIWVNRRRRRWGLLVVMLGWTMETARIPLIGCWWLIVVAHPQNNCYEIILRVMYYGSSFKEKFKGYETLATYGSERTLT